MAVDTSLLNRLNKPMTIESFTPDNTEVWIDNYKRKDVIGDVVARSYLSTWPDLERINIIVNHPSVILEDDFSPEIRSKIKLWPNVLRHPLSRGPITKNINQAYIHTFLSGKKWCVFAHDSYVVTPGWRECVVNNPGYDLYMAPQGDGFFITTLNGLKTFGWWDEGYTTMGWHEINHICCALRKSHVLNQGRSSIYDRHRIWPKSLSFVSPIGELHYNSVGLENHVVRLPMATHPQIGSRARDSFTTKAEKYHNNKWEKSFETQEGTLYNIMNGPKFEAESLVDFYPWIDINTLGTDRTAY